MASKQPKGDIVTLLDLTPRDVQDGELFPLSHTKTWWLPDPERRVRPFTLSVQQFPIRGPTAFGQRFTFDLGSVKCGDVLLSTVLQVGLGHWLDDTSILRFASTRYTYAADSDPWYYASSLGSVLLQQAELEIDGQTIETIDGDINNLAFGSATDVFGNPTTYSLVWDNEDFKTKYEQYVVLDVESGVFNISKPMEALPEGQTLEIVKFKIKQTSTVGEAFSPNLFFFATDPSRDASYDYNTDIASALENINSQSYFAAWRGAAIK